MSLISTNLGIAVDDLSLRRLATDEPLPGEYLFVDLHPAGGERKRRLQAVQARRLDAHAAEQQQAPRAGGPIPQRLCQGEEMPGALVLTEKSRAEAHRLVRAPPVGIIERRQLGRQARLENHRLRPVRLPPRLCSRMESA